jgi:hypothetical protein
MPTDLYWTLDGDLALGEDGDLRDTSFDTFRSLWQECRTRLRSSFKDWVLHPSLGANLDELLGELNNRATAEEGKTRIISALTLGGFLPREAIRIRYLPIGRHRLLYDITVSVFDPGSGKTRMLKNQLLYDTAESGLTVI